MIDNPFDNPLIDNYFLFLYCLFIAVEKAKIVMPKRRLALDIDDVMNDINNRLEVEPDNDGYAEDNLNELVSDQDDGDYDNDIIDYTEEDINEDERDVT